MTIRDSNYITILAPMITRLKLKGNELLVFALIHGFSQDGESRFKGSLRYLIEWTGLDKTTVIKILKSLVEKQYITKFEYEKNKVRSNPVQPILCKWRIHHQIQHLRKC